MRSMAVKRGDSSRREVSRASGLFRPAVGYPALNRLGCARLGPAICGTDAVPTLGGDREHQ